jgi:prolyl-tRNA synthetase
MPGNGFGLSDVQAKRFHMGLLGKQPLEPEDGLKFSMSGKIFLEKSPLVGLLTVQKDEPEFWMLCGMALENIFLFLLKQGFSLAIHAAIVEVGLINKIFAATLGTTRRLTALFRVGKVKNQKDLDIFYEEVKRAYMKIFTRCGIGHRTYITFASGGTFSQFSHEFQTISEAGEDVVYVEESKNVALNEEIITDEILKELGVERENLVAKKSIEVGNIFKQSTKFTDPFDLSFQDEKGNKNSIYMGGYGIGVTRLMGTIVEVLSDDKGIIWPEAVAPFKVHLLVLGEDEAVKMEANKVYERLLENNIEVLFDDREGMSPGEKFADADLLGMPIRVVVSLRSMKENGVEVKKRTEEKGQVVGLEELLKTLKDNV